MVRGSRNGLRPISATNYKEDLKGYFHCFSQEGSLEDGIGLYATIELEDGTVTQVDAYQIKFDDVSKEGAKGFGWIQLTGNKLRVYSDKVKVETVYDLG